jgi:LuxR family maltose regulon positive regulatory protein
VADKNRILQRGNINKALQNILNYPLTIVAAPMGYGKTTAVREFFRKSSARFSWLCLGEASANCGYFWDQLVRQIPDDFQNLKTDLHGLGFPANRIKTARVVETLLAASSGEDFCLVLDDYYHAENEPLNLFMEAIAKSEIPNFHLVIVSRHLPKINLTELIVKNLAVQIDIDLFRFSDEDVLRYFSLMGLPLKKADISDIQSIAGGWVSALYLIYRGLKGGIPLKNITAVEELLKTAIYEPYDEEAKTALCALAPLAAFTVDLAGQAAGIQGIEAIIKNLCRENAFIEWYEPSGIYTIHSVFARFLNEEALRRGLNIKEISRRAGNWYLDRQDYTQAFRYLIQGEAYDILLEALERPALYISADDRPALLRCFDSIPQQQKDSHPIACLRLILFFIITSNRKRGLELLQQFERDLPETMSSPGYDREVRAGICVVKMFLSFNDIELMLSYIDDALELLNGGVSVISSYQGPFSFGSPHFTFIYYKEPGAYKKTAGLSYEKYAQLSGGNGMGAGDLCSAEYALETGNFGAVEGCAYKAIYRARTKKQHALVVCATLTLARLYLIQGKYPESLFLLDHLADEVASNIETILLDTYDLCKGYFYASTGEINKIPRWIVEGDMSVNSLLFQGLVFSYVVYGKTLISSGDWLKAEALCETFTPYFDVFHNQLGYIHNYIHLAIAVYRQGDHVKAKDYLKKALNIGQVDHIVMPFVENGVNLLPLLKDINQEDSVEMDYVRRLIELCIAYAPVFAGPPAHQNPLSPRETEVLELMARGLSRQEIAAKMFLSPGTVRTHIQNIYNKLNATKKSNALQKAAEMKILS